MNSWDLSSLGLEPHAPKILSSTCESRAIALVMPAGESLQEHQVHERAWVVVIAGAVEMTTPAGQRVVGAPGVVAEFDPAEHHTIRALCDARLLLLLSPWPGAGHPGPMSLEDKGRSRERAAERRDGSPEDRSASDAAAVAVAVAGPLAGDAEPAGARAGAAGRDTPAQAARTGPGMRRDETARLRDMTAGSRDLAAEARDRVAGREEEALLAAERSRDSTIRALLAASGGVRGRAAADRAGAASDRRRAAADRAQAGADSGQARVELQHAQLDGLTRVYARDLGHATLQHEIDRSRRSGEPFVLAFVDVDGLKERNDRDGHAAGDALLQAVVVALRSQLRSYDPIVRIGGDEFVCGFTNTELGASRRRVEEIRAAVEQGPLAGSITVGVALLDESDSLADLTARADADMYSRKQQQHARSRATSRDP